MSFVLGSIHSLQVASCGGQDRCCNSVLRGTINHVTD
jgi:hypothetical protein